MTESLYGPIYKKEHNKNIDCICLQNIGWKIMCERIQMWCKQVFSRYPEGEELREGCYLREKVNHSTKELECWKTLLGFGWFSDPIV